MGETAMSIAQYLRNRSLFPSESGGPATQSEPVLLTESRDLTIEDSGKILASNLATPITLTRPAGLPKTFNCTIQQLGAGQITFIGLQNALGHNKTISQNALASIIPTPVQDLFLLAGMTTA